MCLCECHKFQNTLKKKRKKKKTKKQINNEVPQDIWKVDAMGDLKASPKNTNVTIYLWSNDLKSDQYDVVLQLKNIGDFEMKTINPNHQGTYYAQVFIDWEKFCFLNIV